jgi:hypothetical protein
MNMFTVSLLLQIHCQDVNLTVKNTMLPVRRSSWDSLHTYYVFRTSQVRTSAGGDWLPLMIILYSQALHIHSGIIYKTGRNILPKAWFIIISSYHYKLHCKVYAVDTVIIETETKQVPNVGDALNVFQALPTVPQMFSHTTIRCPTNSVLLLPIS